MRGKSRILLVRAFDLKGFLGVGGQQPFSCGCSCQSMVFPHGQLLQALSRRL